MALFDASASDAALVAEALRDNPAAFERLVLRYQRQAHAIARALGVPPDSVDDVVQESFLQALSGLRGLRSPAAFGPWLLAIARNLSRKEVAARRHAPGPPPETGATVEAPGGAAALEDMREVLWREVARLPEGVREVIFLYYHEGKSVRHVARALAISRSAVKSRLQRGRDQLRERLWRELEEALREVVPSAAEWRRRGRKLTLLLVTASATEGAMVSAAAAAPPAPQAVAGISQLFLAGGLVMSAKKVLVGAALASILLAASIGTVKLASTPRGAGEHAAAPSAPAPLAASFPAGRVEEEVAAAAIRAPAVTGISGSVRLRETSAPVAGARVAAVRDGERRHAVVVETGADGAYLLAGLRPGKYRLWAWKEDLACRRSGDPEVEVRQRGVTGGQDLVLVPGVVIEGRVVEEGTVKPVPAAEIGFERLQFTAANADGRFRLEGVREGLIAVTASAPGYARRWIDIDAAHGERPFVTMELAQGLLIEGTVSEPGGGPAAGAEVAVWGSGGGSARTGDDGRYRIDGLPLTATGMEVTASRQGRFATRAGVSGFPPGESRVTLDLRLAEGYLLRGRVVDPAGRPLAGARIKLVGSSVFEEPRADEQGRFAIDGAGDNMYTLHVRREGHAPGSVNLRELPPERREKIEVVLEEGFAVEGTVADLKEAPIAGASVHIEDESGLIHTTETDSGGQFRIEDLPAELSEIGAGKGGYAESRSEDIEAGQRDIRIVLHEAGKIEGIAVDAATAEPVRPLLVKVSFAKGELAERNRKRDPGAGLYDRLVEVGLPFDFPDGGFKIRHELVPGIFYRVLVVAPGYAEAGVDVEAWPRSEAREPIRVELERGGLLRGRVVAAATGEPVEGVKASHVVEHRDGGRDYWDRAETPVRVALTGAGGDFEIDGLPEVPGVIFLEKPGFARTAIAGVGPGPEVKTLELAAAAALEGTVLGVAGEPIPGVAVAVIVDEEDFPRASTDERGSYRIDGLPPGTARVEAALEGRLKKVRTVTLVAGETTVIDFLDAPGAIVGRVTDGGRPLPGARVHVKRVGHSGEQENFYANPAGEFRAAGLDPGSYEVKASRPDAGFLEGVLTTVDVGSGEARCDIALGAAIALNGHVVDRVSGSAVPGAHVMLFKHSPGFFGAGLAFPGSDWAPVKGCEAGGEEARFRLEIAEAGKYLLSARAGEGKDFVQGWLAVDVEPAGVTDDIAIRVGGRTTAALTLRDGKTGAPIDGGSIVLRPAGGYPFGVGGRSDAAGTAAIAGIPPGKYRLEAQAPDHLPAFEEIDAGEGPLERAIVLERASWIDVEIGGATGASRSYNIRATVIAGGDPAWAFSTADGKPAILGTRKQGETAMRLKTRAGHYTIRFEVMSTHLSSPPLFARELEVEVPDGGQAPVLLALPER